MIELNTVYNKNCLIGMARIADKSVDMILCDLPYGTTSCKWDTIIPFKPLWEQYERIIKDNGAIVLTASQPFTSALVMSNIKLFKYNWNWRKNKTTGHLNAKKMPLRAFEDIIVFYKKQAIYNPQMTIGKIHGTGGASKIDITTVYGKQKEVKKPKYSNLYYPNNELKFDVEYYPLHPTQKPVALFEYLIKTYTNEGETVLDNCMGSGTTAIACINTNRNYIGFEMDENYFNIINDRIKKHTEPKPVEVNLFSQAN